MSLSYMTLLTRNKPKSRSLCGERRGSLWVSLWGSLWVIHEKRRFSVQAKLNFCSVSCIHPKCQQQLQETDSMVQKKLCIATCQGNQGEGRVQGAEFQIVVLHNIMRWTMFNVHIPYLTLIASVRRRVFPQSDKKLFHNLREVERASPVIPINFKFQTIYRILEILVSTTALPLVPIYTTQSDFFDCHFSFHSHTFWVTMHE